MKAIALITCIFLLSCSQSMIGKYKHRICEEGPNCFYLNLKKDNNFIYEYHQDVSGQGQVTGKYSITNDTLFLFTTPDSAKIISALSFKYDDRMCKKYLIKGKKLYPLQYEPEMVLFGKETYYKK